MAEVKEENKEVKTESKITKQNPWKVTALILGVAVIVLMIFVFRGGITGGVISEGDAAQNLIDFAKSRGADLELVEVIDEGSFYQIVVSSNGQEGPLYVTKDGKYLIQVPMPLTGQVTNTQTQTETPTQVPKSDKPKVELYLMSFCPYGNKAEDTMLPVYNLLKNKVDWSIHYIVSVSGTSVSSLHGQPEVDQDEREACVLSESGIDKWWKFTTYVNTNCGGDGSCWEVAAKSAGLDANRIKTCVSSKGLSLMQADDKASNDAGASGSPTLIINGVKSNSVYQYNSEAYKQAICSAFNEAPEECEKVLSGSTSTSTGGSC